MTRRANRFLLGQLEERAVPAVTNPTPVGYTPAQVRHAYGFDQIPPLVADYNTAGAGQTIAVVMAGDDPNIAADLQVFSQTFGLPAATLVKLTQTGSAAGPWPAVNASWAGEIALDVEWAHAIAPAAAIVLVESKSANVDDFAAAIDTARNYHGVGVVSMSWGLLEGGGELTYDAHLTTPAGHTPVTFVAATLDNGAAYPRDTYWPAASPNVVAVGGTTLTLSGGGYGAEKAWAYSTGGLSPYESQPAFQKGVVTQSTTRRAVPDVSYHADNASLGFPVYDTVPYNRQTGWIDAGGDSAGAPQWAALVAIADQQRAAAGLTTLDGPSQTLPGLYSLAATNYTQFYHDVTSGANGAYRAGTGYDLVTGLGTPRADQLVQGLAALPATGTATARTATAGAKPFGGTAGVGVEFGGPGSDDAGPVYVGPLAPPVSGAEPASAAQVTVAAVYLLDDADDDTPGRPGRRVHV